jgi:hypothetical protein
MSYGQKDFLSQPAPENYVAGLGRGATGFTTRSDLGPAREGPTPEQIQEALAKRAQLLGAAPPTAYVAGREKGGKGKEHEDEDDDDRFQDPENEVGLFAYGQYDREDDEADRIYQEVDERMDRRRKLRRSVSLATAVIPMPVINFFVRCVFFLALDSVPTYIYLSTILQGSSRATRARRIREKQPQNSTTIC